MLVFVCWLLLCMYVYIYIDCRWMDITDRGAQNRASRLRSGRLLAYYLHSFRRLPQLSVANRFQISHRRVSGNYILNSHVNLSRIDSK